MILPKPTASCFWPQFRRKQPAHAAPLQECAKRGVPIIIFNPLRERGFERFTNPQNPLEMVYGSSTPISSQYHQIMVGGDKAALMGICKAVFALDDAAREAGRERILDLGFIAEHTHGLAKFEAAVRAANGRKSSSFGATRNAIEAAAAVYRAPRRR